MRNQYMYKTMKYPAKFVRDYVNAPIQYCTGIKELREAVGGRLHYSKNAKCYMGVNDGVEYVAMKVEV